MYLLYLWIHVHILIFVSKDQYYDLPEYLYFLVRHPVYIQNSSDNSKESNFYDILQSLQNKLRQ